MAQAETLAAHGFTFCITNGHTKKEFAATHQHGRAKFRTCDVDELANVLALYERANVKAFAPPGRVILDIDKHSADGFAALANAGHELPPTNTEVSPTDGAHLFYALPNDCAGWAGNLTTAAHGIAGVEIISGANHPVMIAGGIIRGIGEYTLTNEAPIAPAPAWMVEIIRADLRETERKRIERETRIAALGNTQPIPGKTKRTEAWAHGAMFKECAALATVGAGGRNDALIRAAFVLGQLTPHYVSADEVGRALLTVALGWDGKENTERRKIDKAITRGAASPRYLTDAEKQDESRAAVAAMRRARESYQGWGGKVENVQMPNILAVVDAALIRAERAGRIDIEMSVRLTAELARMGKTSAHRALFGARSIDLMALTGEAYEAKGSTYTLKISGFMSLLRQMGVSDNDTQAETTTVGQVDIISVNSPKRQMWDKRAGGDVVEQGEIGQIHTTHPPMLICPTFVALENGTPTLTKTVDIATVARWADLGAFELQFNRVWTDDETGDYIGETHYPGVGRGARIVCEALTVGPLTVREIIERTHSGAFVGLSSVDAKRKIRAARRAVERILSRLADVGIVARADGVRYTFAPGADGAVMALVSGGDTSATRHNKRHARHVAQRATYHHYLEQKRARARGDVPSPLDEPQTDEQHLPEHMRVILPTVRTNGNIARPPERIKAGAILRGRLANLAERDAALMAMGGA